MPEEKEASEKRPAALHLFHIFYIIYLFVLFFFFFSFFFFLFFFFFFCLFFYFFYCFFSFFLTANITPKEFSKGIELLYKWHHGQNSRDCAEIGGTSALVESSHTHGQEDFLASEWAV